MIAACPKCQTRYRVEAERLGPDGARLRCSQCSAVFRVRLPETTPPSVAGPIPAAAPPAPVAAIAPPEPRAVVAEAPRAESRPLVRTRDASADAPHFDRERLVLVAHPNADACKRLAEALEEDGLQVLVAHDGVEAILSIQRALPAAVVLDAALPKMFGFQVCELVKRNESLRSIHVCLMGAIHKEERYRRAPNEIYGADFYVEPPELPGALIEWLGRVGLPSRSRPARPEPPAPLAEVPVESPAAAEVAARMPAAGSSAVEDVPAPRVAPDAAPAPPLRVVAPAEAPPAAPTKLTLGRIGAPADPLTAERAQAERLARIIVSDIVLYNDEKFTAAIRSGNALEVLSNELEEGRALFRERIDARVREERDFLADELVRVARARGMA